MPLTIKEIENAKPKEKKYKLTDGGGLCLVVQPWGAKFWLWRYRFEGIEKNMTFGEYLSKWVGRGIYNAVFDNVGCLDSYSTQQLPATPMSIGYCGRNRKFSSRILPC